MLRDFLACWWDWRPSSRGVIALTVATLVVMWVSGRPAWAVGMTIVLITAAATALFAFLELYGAAGADLGEAGDEPAETEEPATGGAFAVAPTPDPARHVNLREEQP